jgi:glycerate kinase
MKILIAPNAFKNSLSAQRAADAIADGFQSSGLDCKCVKFPVGDGGDGTGELLMKYLNAMNVEVCVHDPLRREINSSFGYIEESATVIIEMASASGLKLLKDNERDVLDATSLGTGELIRAGLEKNARETILCLGGSATVDGGTGILDALGVKFLNSAGNAVANLPNSLNELASIDLSGIHPALAICRVSMLCDVINPVIGTNGAACVFGPQKGATAEDVGILEQRLLKLVEVIKSQFGKDVSELKSGGAAGGVPAILFALINAEVESGIDYFLKVTDFEKQVIDADVVITGEGSLDVQTLLGKAPVGVARIAQRYGKPVIALAGRVEPNDELKKYFNRMIPIQPYPFDPAKAIRETFGNLFNTAQTLGGELARHEFRA